MDKENPHLLSPAAFQGALKDGHYVKVIKALKAGQDIHAPIPQAYMPKPAKPPSLALMWRWEKVDRAMEVMELLLKAGADPNLPDDQGRRPLHTWLWLTDAPKEAIQRLIVAGADPLFKSAITPGKSEQSALQACLYNRLSSKLEWITEVIPHIGVQHDERWEDPIMRSAIQNTRNDTPENRALLLALLASGASMDAADKFGRTGRSELFDTGFQLDIINQWEEMIRAQEQAIELTQQAPNAPGGPIFRRI